MVLLFFFCFCVVLLGFLLWVVLLFFPLLFAWCCFPHLIWVGLRSASLQLGGAAWFSPSSWVVLLVQSPFRWCCLPSPPLSGATFPLSSVGWCFGWCCFFLSICVVCLPFVLWVGLRSASLLLGQTQQPSPTWFPTQAQGITAGAILWIRTSQQRDRDR